MKLGIEECLGVTQLTLEALLALPLALGDGLDWRTQAEGVECLVAYVAVEKVGLLSG